MEIIRGLGTSIMFATVSLFFTMIFGFLLCLGITSKLKLISSIVKLIAEFVYAIPLVVMLITMYYNPLILDSKSIGIIVISIVGSIDIAFNSKYFIMEHKLEISIKQILQVICIKSLTTWSKLIGYTALLSLIGITELFKAYRVTSTVTGKPSLLITSMLIYPTIFLICRILEGILIKRLITNANIQI